MSVHCVEILTGGGRFKLNAYSEQSLVALPSRTIRQSSVLVLLIRKIDTPFKINPFYSGEMTVWIHSSDLAGSFQSKLVTLKTVC